MKWIVFSDLHVTAKTVDVAVEVLNRVHAEAVARDAGILFLGDFWTERGRLPTAPLNQIITAMADWIQPAIFLPGNHDQVDLGGEVHGIKPIESAVAVVTCLDTPQVHMRALFVPYRRRSDEVLQAITDFSGEYDAVFCHIDVVGAYMNDAIQAGIGLLPEQLPSDVPIYTGHYHKPHRVEAAPNICYIGSPYQVSHHEAGETKRLLVLDADAGWVQTEEIELDIGPRHWSARLANDKWTTTVREIRAGDRVVTDMDRLESAWPAAATGDIAEWRRSGATVEVRIAPAQAESRIDGAESMPPLDLWHKYGDVVDLPEPVAVYGAAAIRACESVCVEAQRDDTDLAFVSVEAAGFGPFIDTICYPLDRRGAVLVTGTNADMPGSESNGAGKTTLVMAALWALTGESDTRPDGASPKALSKELVNHASENATVTVELRVNGATIRVRRAMGKAGHKLAVWRDGSEVTQQDVDLTQRALDAIVDTGRVARTIFFGQHETAGFLDATDKGAKDMLGDVVDIAIWEASRLEAAERRKAADKAADVGAGACDGALRQSAAAQLACDQARGRVEAWRSDTDHAVAAQHDRIEALLADETRWVEAQRGKTGDLLGEINRLTATRDEWEQEQDVAIRRATTDVVDCQNASVRWGDIRRDRATAAAEAVQIAADLRDAVDVFHADAVAAARNTADQAAAKCSDAALREATERLAAANRTKAALVSTPPQPSADAARHAVATADSAVSRLEQRLAVLASEGKTAARDADEYRALTGSCDRCLQKIDTDQHAEILAVKLIVVERHRATYREVGAGLGALRQAATDARVAVTQAVQADDAATQAWRGRCDAAQAGIVAVRAELDGFERTRAEAQRAAAHLSELTQRVNPHIAELAALQRAHNAVLAEADPHQIRLPGLERAVALIRARVCPVPAEIAAAETRLAATRAETWPGSPRVEATRLEAARLEAAVNPYLGVRADAEQVLARAAAELTDACRVRDEARQDAQIWRDTETHLGRTGVQSFVLESAVGDLQQRVQRYLDELSDGYLRLQMSATGRNAKGQTVERLDRKILVRRATGDYAEFKLRQLSGGQRRRVLIATTLAFAEFVAARTGLRSELVVFDEVFQHLDAAGRAKINGLVRQLTYRTILVISHDTDLAAQFDHVDTVRMCGDTSRVEIG